MKLRNVPLIHKFNVVSLVILLVCLVVLGRWVSAQIERRVVERVGHTASLFAGSVIAPSVLKLIDSGTADISSDIGLTLLASGLGDEIVSLKVWGRGGLILYSTNPNEIGAVHAVEAGLQEAWSGAVSAEMSSLGRDEHQFQREISDILLETYSPIRAPGTGQIVAVVEFYQRVDSFLGELRKARAQSWAVTAAVVAFIYLSLMALVHSGSRTIVDQRDQLQHQVKKYRSVLKTNDELHERLRLAASRSTALNEQYLRRIAAELHDGPGQEIGYALLTLERLTDPDGEKGRIEEIATGVKNALERSLTDVRTISSGLRTPELETLSIEDVIRRAVRIHKSRTGADPHMELEIGSISGSLASKITIFRVVQEALSNSYRHALDIAPIVRAVLVDKNIYLVIADHGPGLDGNGNDDGRMHLGLEVMSERVELLGGQFAIEAADPRGTLVSAIIPFQE